MVSKGLSEKECPLTTKRLLKKRMYLGLLQNRTVLQGIRTLEHKKPISCSKNIFCDSSYFV